MYGIECQLTPDRSQTLVGVIGTSEYARLWIDAIRSGTLVKPDFADGYKAQLVIDAAIRSQHEGRRVEIE